MQNLTGDILKFTTDECSIQRADTKVYVVATLGPFLLVRSLTVIVL